jgi:hypothetical protein
LHLCTPETREREVRKHSKKAIKILKIKFAGTNKKPTFATPTERKEKTKSLEQFES